MTYNSNKPHVTIGTIGNVNDGKTTLISAITYVLSKRIPENRGIFKSFEQLDNTTHVEYETTKRHYVHIDIPGHTDNVKKLMSDIAQMDGAIIVVSPPDGDEPLTLIHLLLARLLNVPRVVVFINKCDMEVDEDILNIIEIEMQDLLEMLEFDEDTPFIRGSALGALNGVPEWEDMVMELVNAVDDWILMPDNSQPSISPIKILNNVISRSIHFITRDLEPTRLFLGVLEQLIKQGLNNDDLGQIRIIQSLCCLKYSATHLDDNSLLRKGEECVDIGFNLKREKNEDSTLLYSFIKLIYRRIKINNNNSNAYDQHNNINNEFRSLQARKSAENNEIFAWLKDNIYFPASFNCIQASYYNYLNNKDYVNAANCLHLIQDLNVDYYTVWTCNEFYNLYTMENGLQPINKAYEYSEQGIQIANDSEHFNSDYIDLNNVFYVAWCHCWNNLGLCYYNGYGVNPDGAEVFKCFETAAQLGLHVAINNLAYCYENGIGVDEDCFTACELYKKAFEAGFEDAKAEYERLVSLGYDDSQNRNNVGSGNGYNDHQQMQWDDTYPTRETPNNSNKPNPSIDNTFDW
ncbi:MAG: SEL1-like repeat protein [Bacteroidaceae bacterium]|nr:SEL1-like repeat protein [Bacteroidaceae bacterium]